jgi:hypothetical protein
MHAVHDPPFLTLPRTRQPSLICLDLLERIIELFANRVLLGSLMNTCMLNQWHSYSVANKLLSLVGVFTLNNFLLEAIHT